MNGRTAAMREVVGYLVAGAVGSVMIASSAAAQKIPIPIVQEALIKGTLLTFNDANATGNYDVLYDKLSKPFQEKFPPERLKEAFKIFAEKHIDFKIIAAKAPIAKQEPSVNDKGVLSLYGHFDTTPSRVYYELEYIMSDGEWKPIRIDVNIKKPDDK